MKKVSFKMLKGSTWDKFLSKKGNLVFSTMVDGLTFVVVGFESLADLGKAAKSKDISMIVGKNADGQFDPQSVLIVRKRDQEVLDADIKVDAELSLGSSRGEASIQGLSADEIASSSSSLIDEA